MQYFSQINTGELRLHCFIRSRSENCQNYHNLMVYKDIDSRIENGQNKTILPIILGFSRALFCSANTCKNTELILCNLRFNPECNTVPVQLLVPQVPYRTFATKIWKYRYSTQDLPVQVHTGTHSELTQVNTGFPTFMLVLGTRKKYWNFKLNLIHEPIGAPKNR